MLEDHADAPALAAQGGTGQGGYLDPIDQHPAGGGFFELVDDADQRRFAGTGPADDAVDLAGPDGEADIV